jgi:hypothetical protein
MAEAGDLEDGHEGSLTYDQKWRKSGVAANRVINNYRSRNGEIPEQTIRLGSSIFTSMMIAGWSWLLAPIGRMEVCSLFRPSFSSFVE